MQLNERPRSFELEGTRYTVERVIDAWIGEGHRYFKVRTEDGGMHLLGYDEGEDAWSHRFVHPRTST